MIRLEVNAPDQALTRFVIHGEPASKARARFTKRGSKVVAWTPQETQRAERDMRIAYLAAIGGTDEPVATDKDAAFGVVATFYCGTGQRRDVDNMLKLICDALNKVAWVDDSQVTFIAGRKLRVTKEEARTEVAIYDQGRIPRAKATCEHCQQSYNTYATWANKRFCSQSCHLEFRRLARLRVCRNAACGKEFEATNGVRNLETGLFCSRACYDAAHNIELICATCGAVFTKPKSLANKRVHHCSVECQDQLWMAREPKRPLGACEDCGGPTSKPTYVCCQACRIKRRRDGAA